MVNEVEVMFQKYDSCLKKLANVFSYKSRGTIDRDDFYQEFAIRLMELVRRYADKPDSEFRKILNFSLHNLGVDLLRQRFSYFTVDHTDEANEGLFKTVVEPSFLFFYREATLSMLRSTKAKEIFEWLVEHPNVVEQVREEKNLVQQRCRKVALVDVVDTVTQTFHIARCEARYHVHQIRKAIWSVYSEEFCY